MENKRSYLTPLKRPNDALDANRPKKPTPNVVTGYRKLKILLPNGMTVSVKLSEKLKFIYVKELVEKVKEQYDRIVESKKDVGTRRHVNWDGEGVCFVDDYDNELKNQVKLSKLKLDRVYNLRLDDGSKPADIYENMWDLTPDTELLMELPEEYTFETALADLIDNSLQAVWSNDQNDRRLIRVEVSNEKISIVDTGPGMDDSSIEKWGKMGASLHRASKTQAIGGKPPYLNPAFGMFGYGGFIASMHLGRHTEVSSKTKDSKKVYMLRLQRDALVRGSGSKQTWRTSGSVRDPSGDELELSPGGSFTKVDIYEPKMKNIDIRLLKCKLKDIYFPYIQCDDFSKGKIIMPIEFQVNGDDLAEIPGGEVAITNLSSCNGPEFVLQLHFELKHDNATTTSSPGSRSSNEANARLRCVYLPVKEVSVRISYERMYLLHAKSTGFFGYFVLICHLELFITGEGVKIFNPIFLTLTLSLVLVLFLSYKCRGPLVHLLILPSHVYSTKRRWRQRIKVAVLHSMWSIPLCFIVYVTKRHGRQEDIMGVGDKKS